MTVHSLPAPHRMAQDSLRAGRWRLLGLLLVCAAPVLASYFTYYIVRPEGRRNYGELISPQKSLPDVLGHGLAGQPLLLSQLKGQWLLLSVAGAACDAKCQAHLYLQRQLREGLGKDKERMDWVWLISDDAQVPASALDALKRATVLRVPAPALTSWLAPAAGAQLEDHLYLVDPIGNWMMRFPANLDVSSSAKARRDLERLMRASAFWDQAGR